MSQDHGYHIKAVHVGLESGVMVHQHEVWMYLTLKKVKIDVQSGWYSLLKNSLEIDPPRIRWYAWILICKCVLFISAKNLLLLNISPCLRFNNSCTIIPVKEHKSVRMLYFIFYLAVFLFTTIDVTPNPFPLNKLSYPLPSAITPQIDKC